MSPVVAIGTTIIIGIISVGGLALFLKSGKPLIKWGGLLAFGVGLFLLLFDSLYLLPPP